MFINITILKERKQLNGIRVILKIVELHCTYIP